MSTQTRLADLPLDPPDDEDRCNCRQLTGNSRHVWDCPQAEKEN